MQSSCLRTKQDGVGEIWIGLTYVFACVTVPDSQSANAHHRYRSAERYSPVDQGVACRTHMVLLRHVMGIGSPVA